jgi:hypothetical protein
VATGRRGDAKRSREARWGGVPAQGRRREGLGEVWGAPGVIGVAFIGPGEGAEGVAEVTAAMNSRGGKDLTASQARSGDTWSGGAEDF